MQKKHFYVIYDNPNYWVESYSADNEVFEEPMPWSYANELANGFLWSISTKVKGQRKFHFRSPTAKNVYALLEYAQSYIAEDCDIIVKLQTPDVEIIIGC